MKVFNKLILIAALAILVSLVLPGRAFAAAPASTPIGDKIIFGGTYTLGNGETLDGSLAVFGGTATVEQGAKVDGDVILAGGTVNIDGEVDGDLVLFGGAASLDDHAVIHGNVNTFGAALHRDNGARIEGEVISGSNQPFTFDIPRQVFVPNARIDFHPLLDVFGFFARTLGLAALAIIVVMLAPNASNRTALAATAQPALTAGIGLLTAVIAVPVLVLLTITILLIPVSLLALFVLIAAMIFGWIALGLEVGKRVAQLFKVDWPLPISAGIGTFVLSIVTSIIGFIPCVGWLAPVVVGLIGLGAVLVTRFGTRGYPAAYAYTPVAPVPPAAPMYPAQPIQPVPPAAPVSPEPPTPVSRVDVYEAPEAPEDQPPADATQL